METAAAAYLQPCHGFALEHGFASLCRIAPSLVIRRLPTTF